MDHRTPDVSSAEHPRTPKRRRTATKAPQARTLPTLIAPDVEAEALLRSTLDALSAHIAVLDEASYYEAMKPFRTRKSVFLKCVGGQGWRPAS